MSKAINNKKQTNSQHYLSASKISPYFEVDGQVKKQWEVKVEMTKANHEGNRKIPQNWTVNESRGKEFEFIRNLDILPYHPWFFLKGEESGSFKAESSIILPAFFPHVKLKLKDQAEPELETVEILNASDGGVVVLGPYGPLKFPHYGILNVSAYLHHEPGEDAGSLFLEVNALVDGYADPEMDDPEEYVRRSHDDDGRATGDVFIGILSARQKFNLRFNNSTGKWDAQANYNREHSLIFIS